MYTVHVCGNFPENMLLVKSVFIYAKRIWI